MASNQVIKSRVSKATQMFPQIQKWELSGLSQKEFCERHDIKPHVFYYWLRHYRAESQVFSKETSGFVSVQMEESPGESVVVEVIYVNGTRVVFKEGVGLNFLRGLLDKE
jgi:hypothetical protein